MELHRRSCVLPSNAPVLPESDQVIPSRVLQERSGNRQHGYPDGSASWKRSPSSPVENLHSQNLSGSYLTGNLGTQLHGEKSEEQIHHETKRLLALLQRCEKYQKYRDRQPQNAKEREQKWPEFLEEAFFRGLVRWPPMGRRKHMLDGQLRGRNELVADSIQKETGIPRTRKQVSSHIQVLKNILSDQPQLLVYMSTEDMGGRKRHASSHLGHLRSRHYPSSSSSKYQNSQNSEPYSQAYGLVPSSRSYGGVQPQDTTDAEAPFSVTHFALLVLDKNRQPVHCVTQLADNPRLPDLNIIDIASWRKQYPELSFHRTEEWKERQVLVCQASIKIMTESELSAAELAIPFHITALNDQSMLEPWQCRTRFYDNGELANQSGTKKHIKTETLGNCEFASSTSRMLWFGSKFWAHRLSELRERLRSARMQEEQSAKTKLESGVRHSLQYMTAVQDIYCTKVETKEQHCFLTILWRFHQTRTSSEPGRMTWRVVNFPPPAQQPWIKGEELDSAHDLKLIINSTSSEMPRCVYPSLPLELSHQPFEHHPLQLDLESLTNIPFDGLHDFSHPNSAIAPSMGTDYSQTHSLPSLTHSHETGATEPHEYQDANDMDFHGVHIHMHLGSAINFGAYENYGTNTPSLNPLNPITSLDHAHSDAAFGDMGLGVAMASCYPSKPWHYSDLVSRMEGAAEQTQSLTHQTTSGADIVGHGVLHDGQLGQGVWKLQTGFGEDAVVGADDGRKEQAHSILEMIEQDQRGQDRLRGY